MTRLLIREAHLYEYDDIRKFYRDNPDEHVMIRSEAEVKNAINEGVFFLCIDPSADENARIVAASAVYTVSTLKDTGDLITLKEAGGSIVSKPFRGFGIHKVFHWARSLHEFILDRRGFQEYFGAIIHPNPESAGNANGSGFVEWPDVPRSLIAARLCYIDSSKGQSLKFFRLPEEALQDHARKLLEQERFGLVENRRAGTLQQYELHLDIEILKRYRPIVEAIAQHGGPYALSK